MFVSLHVRTQQSERTKKPCDRESDALHFFIKPVNSWVEAGCS